MKKVAIIAAVAVAAAVLWTAAAQQPGGGQAKAGKKGFNPPPIQPKPEELAAIEKKTDEVESILAPVKSKRGEDPLVADVDVYVKAGRFLCEFPQTFFTQAGIDQAMTVLDQGIERARQLRDGHTPWVEGKGRKVHAYYSPLDGSVQPYGVTIPESYDGTKPVRRTVRGEQAAGVHQREPHRLRLPQPPSPRVERALADSFCPAVTPHRRAGGFQLGYHPSPIFLGRLHASTIRVSAGLA